jgi:nitrite reductase/ring-hydroxylating ferredoxin subunit
MASQEQIITVGGIDDIPLGQCATFETADGRELAIYNVNGEFYATGNFCPHKGAPLAEGRLCGHVIECALHGWQFDVRTGEGIIVNEPVESYPVRVEDDLVKVVVRVSDEL